MVFFSQKRIVMQSLLACLLACSILMFIGCGGSSDDGPERAAVSGSVTLDGSPLAEGRIRFQPDKTSEGKAAIGKAVEATIKDGKYSLSVSEGPAVCTCKVLVFANKKTGKMLEADGEKYEEVVQYLPTKYNTETTLSINVEAGEQNKADFSLESQ